MTTASKKMLLLRYDIKLHGWVIDGARGRQRVFATRIDAENYCLKKLHQCPIVVTAKKTRAQELPKCSVWTGAPWDKSFQHLRLK
jgi:hypothetical protein